MTNEMNFIKLKIATNIMAVERIKVIKITSRVGAGTDDDPVRWIEEYYYPDGRILWRDDAPIEQPE